MNTNNSTNISIENLTNNPQVLNIYTYGSQIYGRTTENSDTDYVIVVTEELSESIVENIVVYDEFNNISLNDSEGNSYNIYSISTWKEMIRTNHIVALECSFLKRKSEFIIKETYNIPLEINIIELRKSISSVASNAYVKCKKKLIEGPDYNPYIAKKSLWHSLRILMYGIQCVKHGKIVDYTEANKYYNDIVLNETNDWEYYKKIYQPIYNSLKSELKQLTEKEWVEFKRGE